MPIASPIASVLATVLFCGGLIAVAVVLGRYRDRLQRKFSSNGGIIIRSTANLGDGARLCLVEVEGATILCGLGRGGVTSMERLDRPAMGAEPVAEPNLPPAIKEPFVMPARSSNAGSSGPVS